MNSFEVAQYEFEEISRRPKLKSIIESLLFVSGDTLTIKDICNAVEASNKIVKSILDEMQNEYEEDKRGIKLISINGEYQLVTKSENSEYIQKLLKKNKRQSLSQASLESLAIIAYKQPITRVDIDEIRGVKSESALQRLLEKDLIKEVGRLEVPGKPILFGTTDEFLRQFGLKEIDELPSLDLYDNTNNEIIESMNEAIKEL